MKRALVLAGGGAKIGWASGALQVLMDEAELRFDHYDATSGSVFNLGMLLSGKTATHIADAWANLSPKEFVSFHSFWKYLQFWKLPSLLTQQAARKHILPKWGIDLQKIRSCTEVYGHPCTATFNVVDFATKRVKSLPNTIMDEDYLVAVDAVPGVVPPVEKDGTLYIDAMLLKDANLMEAVRRGADEIWVIWTVEDELHWKGGFWNHFGHIFETCAVGNLKRELDQIEKINRRVQEGTAEPGQRHITVHLLCPDEPVPVDYLFYKRQEEMPPIIESGREWTRRYLSERGYLEPRRPASGGKGVRFTETMRGFWSPGVMDPKQGYELGRHAVQELEFTLTITAEDVDRFIREPTHQAMAEGHVRGPHFNGACPVVGGSFNLFVRGDEGREMRYELPFQAGDGSHYRLRGHKEIRDDAGPDLWSDTTTLFVEVLPESGDTPLGTGILHIRPSDFLRQLMTFRAVGASSSKESLALLGRFGAFFLGGLWEAYGPHYLVGAEGSADLRRAG